MSIFTVFLKNKNIIFKIRRSKVTDYAALNKQTVKILMRRPIRSRLIWISTVCKFMSDFIWYPKLPALILFISFYVQAGENSTTAIFVHLRRRLPNRTYSLEPLSARQREVIRMAFRWWPDGGSLLCAYCVATKNKRLYRIKIGIHFKTFGNF